MENDWIVIIKDFFMYFGVYQFVTSVFGIILHLNGRTKKKEGQVMSKRKDGVFSLLRHIIGNQKKIIKEQEKQTKMLQSFETSKELEVIGFSVTTDTDELLANIDFESNEVITFGGIKVIEHTKKEPAHFKELTHKF